MASFLEHYGPCALVTGASSGIGEQFARELAARGFDLIVSARRSERLESLASELQALHGTRVDILAADLGDVADLARVIAHCKNRELGLVVSNAGFGLKGEHVDTDAQAMDNMLNLNSRAPMLLARELGPQLLARGRGGFLMTGSIEGYLGFPYSAAYSATKAFVKSLGEALWLEWRERGVDVCVLCPGSTDTEALSLQGFDAKTMKGVMTPAEVARQALDALPKGPLFIAGGTNRFFIRFLAGLPRRWGVKMAGAGMKAALKAQAKHS